jgi:allantoinase
MVARGALDLLVRARRAVTPTGELPCAVGIRDGRIVSIDAFDASLNAARTLVLADDEVLLPGLVDTHVHVNEPGRTEWEGFDAATRAAAAGGVTTLLDMPLNSIPPTCDVESLQVKQDAARDKVFVDVGFWGGAIPANLGTLRRLWDAGVFGFKCFLSPSGVEEFPHLDPERFTAAMHEVAAFDGLMIVHAEDDEALAHAPAAHGPVYDDFLASRPRGVENLAIARLIEAARWTGGRAHLLHLSSSDAVPMLATARAEGIRLTVETCPHYLHFTSEQVPAGATEYKCCPPIREAANQELLWHGLRDGVIDCVVSDNSPCTEELKRRDSGDFGLAWGGLAGLQLGLPAVWTGARERGLPLSTVVDWMARRPAELAGLATKGRIDMGYDADLCVFAPQERFTVELGRLHHRNPISAYAGQELYGVVRSTWLRGQEVQRNNEIVGAPRGALLSRGDT